ncbi:hypothetical protein ACFQAT_28365 [Undibacterium arcticum]|uniref:Uncharacterized protein n=1 Tax=Undibacterium arcticum TaxID=1762892 RepID=A0ABV7F6Y5_9BURK
MAHQVLEGVTYVHAAAKDCTASATAPAMYAVGDTVRVDRADGTVLDVELNLVDVAQGNFQGTVKASSAEDVELDDTVSFYFK